MRIESVSPQKDAVGRYRLQLSDGSTLRIYAQTLEEWGLFEGRELTDGELREIRKRNGAVSAKMRAVRVVSSSAVSAADLERRLRQKGETPEDAQDAVSWMEELGFVNDRETGRQLVARGLRKGYGRNRLRQMLYEKRIPKEYMDELLEELPDPKEAITAFLKKKLGPSPDRKELDSAARALLYRGFDWQDIRPVLAEFRDSAYESEGTLWQE